MDCQGRRAQIEGTTCISFGAGDVDEAVAAAVLRAVQPLGVEAALHAVEDRGKDASERTRLAELALEDARFKADQARARFEAVDPRNRNVIGNLSRAWEERLELVGERECQLAAARSQLQHQELTSGERAAYLALGADLERAWNHENVTTPMRKHVLRAVLVEIIVTVSADRIDLVLHWQGGDHTELSVRRRKRGQTRIATDADTAEMIRELARLMPDRAITAFLNRAGKRTGKGNTWTEVRVRALRSNRGIAVYREGERQERNELTQTEAAARLNCINADLINDTGSDAGARLFPPVRRCEPNHAKHNESYPSMRYRVLIRSWPSGNLAEELEHVEGLSAWDPVTRYVFTFIATRSRTVSRRCWRGLAGFPPEGTAGSIFETSEEAVVAYAVEYPAHARSASVHELPPAQAWRVRVAQRGAQHLASPRLAHWEGPFG